VSHQPDYRIHSELGTDPTRKAPPTIALGLSCQAFEAAGPEQAPTATEIKNSSVRAGLKCPC